MKVFLGGVFYFHISADTLFIPDLSHKDRPLVYLVYTKNIVAIARKLLKVDFTHLKFVLFKIFTNLRFPFSLEINEISF